MGGCFVPGCKSGYKKDNSHLFMAPKGVSARWSQILNKIRADKTFDPSNRNHRLCHIHFKTSELIKDDVFIINGENVSLPRKNWKLTDDAVPTLFPSVPTLLRPAAPVSRRVLVRKEVITSLSSADKILVDSSTLETAKTTEQKEIEFDLQRWWDLNQSSLVAWKIDISDHNRARLYKLNFMNNCPQVSKAIVINPPHDLKSCKMYIATQEVTDRILQGSQVMYSNLLQTLANLDALSKCEGIRDFQKVAQCKGGTLQNGVWFSTQCDDIGQFIICTKCKLLHQRLLRMLERKPAAVKQDGEKIRKQALYYKKRSNKLNKERKEYRKEILRLKSHINAINMEDVERKLTQAILPVPMMSNILHSLKLAKVKSARGMRYSADWLLECLLLKIKSPSAYRHLRESKILPLPHPDTLTKLIAAQKCEFGFNEGALKAIQQIYADKLRRDRQGVIVFDEIHLRETIEFNRQSGKFGGFIDYGKYTEDLLTNSDRDKLANHALVIMYKPMNDSWVQPIAAFATRDAAKGQAIHKVVLEAVVKLESMGAEVLTIVCDGSRPNRSFWKLCGIGLYGGNLTNKVLHPCDVNRYLYFGSDVPHLFKCIRNHLRKYTFAKFADWEVDFSYYEDLLKEDSKRAFGLRKCPKLTKSHIWPNNFEKMKVNLATQLFSRSVTTGLTFYRTAGVKKFQDSIQTEHFTQFMNDVFDALNARFKSDGVTINGEKYKILEDFRLKLQQCTIGGRKRDLQNIQFASDETLLGLRVTIESTLEIIDYLINTIGFAYVLSGKINQDCLEKFFGNIRAAGGREDHPTVTNFIQLFRPLSLYNPIKKMLKGNVQTEDDMRVLVTYKEELMESRRNHKLSTMNRRKELEDILVEKLLQRENEGIEFVYDCAFLNIGILDANIVYYLSGFLCYRAHTILKCSDCKSKLVTLEPTAERCDAVLTDILNYGPLHYPADDFYFAILSLEKAICDTLRSSSSCGDIIMESLEKVAINTSTILGCGIIDHNQMIITSLFPYYATMRLHFYARSRRNELGHGKATRNKRKESKLTK